jgi:C4-dicarboxylate transporter DctM subunit
MTQTSIADLFIAGLGPSAVLAGGMATYAVATNYSISGNSWSGSAISRAFRQGIWSLLMPVIILGGIYSGVFTPTESAAVAVMYALFVELFIHRDITLVDLREVTCETAALLGALFPVLMMALTLNVFMTYQQIPEILASWMVLNLADQGMLMLGANVLLLLTGCIMDMGSAILILAPILQPMAAEMGIDPVHFGIVMVMNLEIGYLTPPLGLNLMVAVTVFREDFWTVCRAVLPFMAIMLLGLLATILWPQLALFLLE